MNDTTYPDWFGYVVLLIDKRWPVCLEKGVVKCDTPSERMLFAEAKWTNGNFVFILGCDRTEINVPICRHPSKGLKK